MPHLKHLFDESRERLCRVPCTYVEDAKRLDEKAFSNGDVYVGTFKGIFPHGKGKYVWADGTVYDGDWEEGKMTGKGQIIWPSRAKYNGDFSGGYLHGSGTFFAPDGSVYKGTWRMNIRHGFGRKDYPNSDIYEGSWREEVLEGSGKYSWNNGNTYTGNWKRGTMHGRGVMKWANGDLYDGFWFNGSRNGSGIYCFADGGYYYGTWTRDLKDGKGIFCPAGSKHPLPPSVKKWHGDSGKNLFAQRPSSNSGKFKVHKASVNCSNSEKMSLGGSLRSSDEISCRTNLSDVHLNLSDSAREIMHHDSSSFTFSHVSNDGQSEGQDSDAIAYEREYIQGICIKEIVKNYAERSHKTKELHKLQGQDAKKNTCTSFFRGNDSYYLRLNLQLGIRYTVGKITPVPNRDVRDSDFGDKARITMFFPSKGLQFTPPHKSIDFYWKDYCPMVFRDLRQLFKLDAAEYMMSICGDDGLRELSSSGKSGSIFYLSHDDKFVIKTLKKSELKVLLKMLPFYHTHVKLHENTLITKFFGVHRITLKGRRKVRFVVMGNMFCTELRIHRRYDLKGSTKGRFTDKEKIPESSTLKDLDLSYEFHMDKLLREALFHQLSLDTHFLEAQGIIDYSLLLGVHFIGPNQLDGLVEPPDAIPNNEITPDSSGVTPASDRLIPPKGLRLVAHEPSVVNTDPGPHIRGSTMRAESLCHKEVDLLLPNSERVRVQLGVNMPAQAHRKLEKAEADSAKVELFAVYDVVLYMGIIDILQEYNAKKKVEHACKSMKYDPETISVVEPELYAKRFLSFLQNKVFPEQPPYSL